jgi:hypothetical protein
LISSKMKQSGEEAFISGDCAMHEAEERRRMSCTTRSMQCTQ